jgi:hypothetical protein
MWKEIDHKIFDTNSTNRTINYLNNEVKVLFVLAKLAYNYVIKLKFYAKQ